MLRKTGFTRFFGGKSSIKTRKSGFTRFFGGKRGIWNRKSGFSGSLKTRILPLVQRTEKRNVWRKKNASLNYIAGLWTLHIPPVLWDRTEMPTVHTHFSYLLRNGCEVPLIARENLDMPDPDRPDQHRLFHNNFTALHFAKPSELLL